MFILTFSDVESLRDEMVKFHRQNAASAARAGSLFQRGYAAAHHNMMDWWEHVQLVSLGEKEQA